MSTVRLVRAAGSFRPVGGLAWLIAWLLLCPAAQAGAFKVALLIGEDEYKTWETLPEFVQRQLTPRGVDCAIIAADPANPNHFPDIAAIDSADVVLISVRRRPLPAAELDRIRAALAAGKGVVGIRTASHAFAGKPKAKLAAGLVEWQDFDTEVLGFKYLNHYGSKEGSDIATLPDAKDSPLLAGVGDLAYHTAGSLYKSFDLQPTTRVLMVGSTVDPATDKPVTRPVAWTNAWNKSRVFYTSLGHPDDFKQPGFNRLLVNALFWAAGRELPKDTAAPAADKSTPPSPEPAAGQPPSPAPSATGARPDPSSPAAKAASGPATALAGNETVARTMVEFKGRGVLSDDSQLPPPDQSMRDFKVLDGLELQLLACEPTIEQPLFMTWDERGRLWVVQYRQYPFPAGLKVVKYDQYLRAVFDRVPVAPPHGEPGADKITVLEDTDGDGRFDHVKDAITGLNICSAVAVGHGGVWVLNPPYLLFYPDADGDATPDGDPQVRLSGFGLEDTHAVANSLKWGPDGWLYGANGSTTTGVVSSEATKNVAFEGQNIWRYHPDTQAFEIFAEGGGNTFSLEIDRQGRVFSGTNSAYRGMFYPQGSYGEKNWGKHGPLTNPYAFGWFKHLEHQGDKNRFTQAMLIYEGGQFPQRFVGQLFAANSLHNQVWMSELVPQTSTYRTVDGPLLVSTPDRWFRPVDIETGPDGAVYIADWCDSRLTHVDPRDTWHKASGRIYRLQTAGARPLAPFDLGKQTSAELIATLGHPNKWFRQQAVRVLAERGDASIVPELAKIATSDDPRALEALWVCYRLGAFHQTPGVARPLALAGLESANEHVRRWTVRLVGDDRRAEPETAAALTRLATSEPVAQVRSQLACSAKRLPGSVGLPIVKSLAARSEDAEDLHLPLLVWWAIESKASSDREAVLALFAEPGFWALPIVRNVVVERIFQRYAMAGEPDDLQSCDRLLALAPTPADKDRLIAGWLESFRGRRIDRLPPGLNAALDEYEGRLGRSDLALALRRRSADAVTKALAVVTDRKADRPTRLTYLEILGETREPRAVDPLLKLLSSETSNAVKRTALEALANFDDPKIGPAVAKLYHTALPESDGVRFTAQRLLAARPASALLLLGEIDKQTIAPTSIAPDVVQALALHADPAVAERVRRIWGSVRVTPAEKQEQVARLKTLARQGGGDPDPGHALFTKRCAVCHTLFGEGGKTGPDLTGYERTNLDFLLTAIVDPSAAIREEFTTFAVVMDDGRTLTGLVTDKTAQTVTLRSADNRATVLDRASIEDLHALPTSLMPENLLKDVGDGDLRNLLAYLMSRPPAKN